jgi:quinol monooxygenase YgiN
MRRINFFGMQTVSSILLLAILLSSCVSAQDKKQLVRLAVIGVDPAQLDGYTKYLSEEIEASIRLEPGVITLYGVAEKDNPERVTLFETYADSGQYRAHLQTPHFQKYKQGTLPMVKDLELIETEPILYVRKPGLPKADVHNLFVRLIKIEVSSSSLDDFKELAQNVMEPGIRKEAGVLLMYAVAEKKAPTMISVLEVYADSAAYENHLTTDHFLTYKKASAAMIKSLKVTDVTPILLGSKAQ